ncbi:hypothetical protein V5O48_003641, partial [Marasmius crinis-equi]
PRKKNKNKNDIESEEGEEPLPLSEECPLTTRSLWEKKKAPTKPEENERREIFLPERTLLGITSVDGEPGDGSFRAGLEPWRVTPPGVEKVTGSIESMMFEWQLEQPVSRQTKELFCDP